MSGKTGPVVFLGVALPSPGHRASLLTTVPDHLLPEEEEAAVMETDAANQQRLRRRIIQGKRGGARGPWSCGGPGSRRPRKERDSDRRGQSAGYSGRCARVLLSCVLWRRLAPSSPLLALHAASPTRVQRSRRDPRPGSGCSPGSPCLPAASPGPQARPLPCPDEGPRLPRSQHLHVGGGL